MKPTKSKPTCRLCDQPIHEPNCIYCEKHHVEKQKADGDNVVKELRKKLKEESEKDRREAKTATAEEFIEVAKEAGKTFSDRDWEKLTPEEKAKRPEWGCWKFVSEMLDNPSANGIYPTSECYEKMADFVHSEKQKSYKEGRREGIVASFRELRTHMGYLDIVTKNEIDEAERLLTQKKGEE